MQFPQLPLLKTLSFLQTVYLSDSIFVDNWVALSVGLFLGLLFYSTGLHICFYCNSKAFISIVFNFIPRFVGQVANLV